MAKGDVTIKMDGENAAFVQKQLQVKNALEANAMAAARMGQAMGKATKEAESGFDKLASKAAGLVATLGSIGAAAATAKSIFDGIEQRRADSANNLDRKITDVRSALGSSGQSESTGAVLDWIKQLGGQKIAGRTAAPSDVENLFVAVSRGAGRRASVETKEQAVVAALTGKALGMPDEQATQVGLNFTRFARDRAEGKGFAGQSDEALTDAAWQAAIYKPEGYSPRDAQFYERMKDKDLANKLIFAGSMNDESAKTFNALLNLDEKSFDSKEYRDLQHEARRSPAKRNELELMRIRQHGGSVISAILANPDLVPDELKAGTRNLVAGLGHVGDIGTVAQKRQAQLLGSTDTSRAGQGSQDIKTITEKILEENEAANLRHENRVKYIDAVFARDYPWIHSAGKVNSWIPRVIASAQELLGPPTDASPNASFMGGPISPFAAGGGAATTRPASDPHLEELKKQTAHLGEINQKTRGNPAMNSGYSGDR